MNINNTYADVIVLHFTEYLIVMVGETAHDVNTEFVIMVFPVATKTCHRRHWVLLWRKTFSTSLTDQ